MPKKPQKLTHLADRGVETRSTRLQDYRVAVAICGGIACVEAVKIIREIRRHGAEVRPFFTPGVTRFMTPLPVEWASSNKVVQEETAAVEYLDPFDAVLVAPATLNTISKSALGLTDNVVTLLIGTQLGRKGRVLFVPTMNLEMAAHPLYDEYKSRLESWGANFFETREEEGRWKMPEAKEVGDWVASQLKKSRG
jgi:phosphopantothenoylcysteine decarboxylase / phosphopantothenate---cysteine ligase